MDCKLQIEEIKSTPFYEIVHILYDFANMDTMVNHNRSLWAWCEDKSSGFLPYEVCIGKSYKILQGITSAYAYMAMTICYISEKPQEGLYKEGFKKYDILRYHYYIYCHCLTTVHDLLFKLIQNLYDFKINKRMISWDTLSTELTRVGALDIISEIEDFYSKIKPHEQKRNSASHEGFLSHKTLDYFYLTQIWTNVQQNQSGELSYPELFEGMPENIDFLDVKQDSFVSELQETMNLAKEHVIRLMTLLLPQLVARIDTSFIKKHELHLASLNKDCLNKYILAMSLFDTNNTAETVISPKKD